MYYKFTASRISESNVLFPPTITFHAYGRAVEVHGFLQREVREMKRLAEERQKPPIPKNC